MTSEYSVEQPYIETPRPVRRPVKISSVLEKRMKEFLRVRRHRLRQEAGR